MWKAEKIIILLLFFRVLLRYLNVACWSNQVLARAGICSLMSLTHSCSLTKTKVVTSNLLSKNCPSWKICLLPVPRLTYREWIGQLLRTYKAAARPHPAIFNELVVTVWLSTELALSDGISCLAAVIFMGTIPLFKFTVKTNAKNGVKCYKNVRQNETKLAKINLQGMTLAVIN